MVMEHLLRLCAGPDRRPGSPANVEATEYVRAVLESLGWACEQQWFDCLDWTSDGGEVVTSGGAVPVVPSPYGTGVTGRARLQAASTPAELEQAAEGLVLLLHGELTSRPLTPRGYPFYSSPEDERLLDLLEARRPLAVLAVTGSYPDLCGALDPFPLVEDGTVTVPVADLRPREGQRLLAHVGEQVEVVVRAERHPARACNVVARRGPQHRRVSVVAHVDTKPGTPGALDNGSGVAAVLAAAQTLAADPVPREVGVELVLVNGEDYYAASGELAYLASADLDQVELAVNLDGVGLPGGPTAWSLYGGADEPGLRSVLAGCSGLLEGPAWYQSDHAVFAMRGRPAVALTSSDMATALGTVAHAPTDTPDRIDEAAVRAAAEAVVALVRAGAR